MICSVIDVVDHVFSPPIFGEIAFLEGDICWEEESFKYVKLKVLISFEIATHESKTIFLCFHIQCKQPVEVIKLPNSPI